MNIRSTPQSEDALMIMSLIVSSPKLENSYPNSYPLTSHSTRLNGHAPCHCHRLRRLHNHGPPNGGRRHQGVSPFIILPIYSIFLRKYQNFNFEFRNLLLRGIRFLCLHLFYPTIILFYKIFNTTLSHHHLSQTIFDTHNFVTHHLSSHTIFLHTHHLTHTTLSHTVFLHHLTHTILSHTVFSHHLTHITLSYTIFLTPSHSHNFVTHHLSHAISHLVTSTFVSRGRCGTYLVTSTLVLLGGIHFHFA